MSFADTRARVPSHFDAAAFFGLLTAIIVCVSRGVLGDGDTYTHIAAGTWMLEHRSVLTRDPLSWTFAGHPWQAHEWLSELFLAMAYRAAGLTGVVLLTATSTAIAFVNLARHIARRSGWTETMLLTAAALVCVLPSILARPHILALPLLELWIAELLSARHDRRVPSWWLLPVMTLWANMHGGFAFGIVITIPFAIEATLEHPDHRDRTVRLWWAFLIAAIGAAVATPQFLNGLLFPLRLLQLHSLSAIYEWKPVDFSTDGGFMVVLLALVVLLGSGRIGLPSLRLFLLAGLLYLALAHRRHCLLFGIAGASILAEPVGRAFAAAVPPRSRAVGRGACLLASVLLVALRLADPVGSVDGTSSPVSAVAQLPPGIARTPVLNSYQFGGYLSLVGLHPFVDGRAELFGDAFLSDFLAMSRSSSTQLERNLDHAGIGWALLTMEDPLVARFDGMPAWRREYHDRTAVVFVRNDSTEYRHRPAADTVSGWKP